MADASFNQASFLGGQWSPNAQGRIDLPVYRTALATSLNGLPVEEGSWTSRSGTRDLGELNVGANGQIKEFWLPGNQAAILELTPAVLRFWVMDTTAGYRALSTTFTTPYLALGVCRSVKIVQADGNAFFLGKAVYVLTCTNFASAGLGLADPTFTFAQVDFGVTDGPYLDPPVGLSQTGNSLGSVSGPGLNLTFTISDGAYSFVSGDVGRGIRLWSQPPAWSSTASYAIGAAVSFGGTYWTAVVGGALQVGVQPGAVTQPPSGSSSVPTQAWTLNPQLGNWAFGKITAVNNSSKVTVSLIQNPLPTAVNGLVIDTWQLGLYTNTVIPTCGVFHAGRLMLSGAVPGRYDFSVANGTSPLSFSPTDQFGNVFDDSGISYPLTLTPVSTALWAISDHAGIVVGSAAGEILITASTLNDPLTPTSIDARWATHYKGSVAEPVRMGIGIGFVQSFGRRLIEYVVDVFSQKFIGRHLNEYSKDLTTTGIRKLVYQEELAPVIWCVTQSNTLLGCTYRRISNFGTEGPLFNGWHTHTLGSGRSVQWLCLGTTTRGTEDVLMLLTQDAAGICRLEMMQPLFDAGQTLQQAWPLDSAFSSGTLSGGDNGGTILTISGLPASGPYSVWLAGLYCGSYPAVGGSIEIPYGSDPDGLLTQEWLLAHAGTTFGIPLTLRGVFITVPCVVGYPFTQTLKLLRPATVEDVRTQTGPGLAKTRRSHMYGLLVANSVTGALISVDNGPTAPISFVGLDQQTKIDHATLYSGVHWDTLDDDYTFDGQIVIQQPLPYPLTIAAVTGFIHTQDR